ncbi:MAG: hypothetical protein NVS1B7_6110 [Candidatus Saccharimonadales bacterium]
MNQFSSLSTKVKWFLFSIIFGSNILLILAWTIGTQLLKIPDFFLFVMLSVLSFVASLVLTFFATNYVLEPLKYLWMSIVHMSPDHQGTAAPNIDSARLGRELLTNLTLQVYQLASQESTHSKDLAEHRKELIQAANIVSHLPLPLFVFNRDQLVTNASDAALEYCKIESSQLFGKQLFEAVNLEFPTDFTLEKWIQECQKSKVTDHSYWERVRLRIIGDHEQLRQCDMAAYYNRDNPSGTEFIVTIFDRTEQYNEDDSSLGFVALAVHELRTPLTVLRGYIEVFEEELEGKLNPELTSFLHKMNVSAKQLTAFVNNILNVARIDEDQLTLHLVEENWESVLRSSAHDIELRAQVHDIDLEYNIAPDLPSVGVDRVSIYEVINNLLDNAIKYSGSSKKIFITTRLNKDGLVETTVQDFGVGIPTSVIPNLFEKFHRNHRNKAQIAGTGLGLYLSKAIIAAHGGQIWVKSKEGEGSVFGFSLQPYGNIAQELKNNNNTDITRSAHGWIKNHSLYRS